MTMTSMKRCSGWTRVTGGEIRPYQSVPGGPLVVRVSLNARGEGRAAFRALFSIARLIARQHGLGRVSAEGVAETLRMTEDKLRLHFWTYTGSGSGVLA